MAREVGTGLSPTTNGLGKLLRDRRLELRLTQDEVGKGAGVSQSEITGLELGRNSGRYLGHHRISKLAGTLDISKEEILSAIPNWKTKPDFGLFIEQRRFDLVLTQKACAKRLKITVGKMSYIENFIEFIPLSGVTLWVKALECSVDDLVPFIRDKGAALNGLAKTKTALGLKIRSKRLIKGISQVELGKRVGVKKQYMSQIELGIALLNESPKLIKAIAKELDIKESELKKLI